MNKLKVFTLMLLVGVVCLFPIQFSSAASVGVKAGDWAKYKITATWNSENPNATEPRSVTDSKNTEWKLVTVEEVFRSNVTILVTTQFKDGTPQEDVYTANITQAPTTSGYDSEFGFQIIPSGLIKGEPVRQSRIVINDTITKEFLGENREVNYAGLRLLVEGVTNYEYYWDRETGFLLKSLYFDIAYDSQGYQSSTWIETEITQTNLWQTQSPQESPQPWLQWGPPIVIATMVLVALLLIKRRSKTKRIRRRRI